MRNIHYFFIALLVTMLLTTSVFAATPVVLETGIHFAADGTMMYKPVGTAQSVLMYPDLQTTKDVSVNTSKGSQALTVTRTPKIDLSRVGAAAVSFAKLLGPIGLGVQVAQIVCDLSKICSNASGLWEKQADPGILGWPSSYDGNSYWTSANFGDGGDGSRRYPTMQTGCAAYVACKNAGAASGSCAGYPPYTYSITGLTSTAGTCAMVNSLNQPENYSFAKTSAVGSCAVGYVATGGKCVTSGQTVNTPAAEKDWTAAKTLLNDSRFIQPLLDKGEAVPVFLPAPVPMIEKVIDTQTVPTLDASGNVTGSQVTTTKLQATDASTPSSPNTFNITESTTVNNYNTSNVLTSTTTTVVNPPAPVPASAAADPVTFDGVTDAAIQTVQVNPPSDSTSWGEGSCPVPQTVTTHFGSLTIPTAPACEFATMIKPIVLLSASLAAMFIVSGIKEA